MCFFHTFEISKWTGTLKTRDTGGQLFLPRLIGKSRVQLHHKAIPYGRVLATEKITRNYCVLCVPSRLLDRKSDRIRLALFRILAVFWGVVSRPVFLFFRDVVRDFYVVVIFRQKTQGIFRYISMFQPKIIASLSDKSRPKLDRGNWGVSTMLS